MATYSIEVSEPAENDLRDIILYISSQLSSPMTSMNMMDTIEEALLGLTEMPQKCPAVRDDRLASMEVIEPEGQLLVVTEHGYGKRTALTEYPEKGRATGGVTTLDGKYQQKTGRIAVARVVQEADEVTLVSLE